MFQVLCSMFYAASFMNIIGHKYVFLIFSGILVLASFFALTFWGIKPSIDFTGGSLLEVEFKDKRPSIETIQSNFKSLGLGTVIIQPVGDHGMILRFRSVDEETHQNILRVLGVGSREQESITAKRFDSIGPTIGKELSRRALSALGLASLGIIIYLAWAFRNVSKPVSSWKYGVIAVVVAFLHDVLIPVGVFSALGHFKNIEVDALFITALLTILGFSVHDTIVVFDRIRENLQKLKGSELFEITVNRSVNETIVRSINTSLTVLLVLLAIFFLGGETVRYFSLSLLIGVIFGTYSSIFVASPLLVIWNNWTKNR